MSDTIEVIDIVDQPDGSAIMNMEDCQMDIWKEGR